MTPKTQTARKKVNFMIDQNLIAEIKIYIPEGERSDFVNEAIEESLLDYKRNKAFEAIAKFRNENKLSMTDEEIIEAKNYGRK